MENIINANIVDQYHKDMVEYAIEVNRRRQVIDYRDGLKLVQRRILQTMYFDETQCRTNTVKSARVIGTAMGKYHPHGTASLYESMKPMANDFESQVPLIKAQGNFGNFQGDGQAAERYTEVMLSEFAKECVIGELANSRDIVNTLPNFDYKEEEFEYLPVKVPLALVNGAFGIGLGLTCDIPKHNLGEVIDVTLLLMDNPNADFVLIPDHCMPCEIIDTDFRQIGELGSGRYRVRGKVDIIEYDQKPYKGYPALVIRSTPDRVYSYAVTDKIEDMVSKGKLPQVKNILEDSTDTDMRHIIILNKGSDPGFVKDMLYKYTPLESTYSVSFELLNGVKPVRSNYRDYILSFIENRKMCKFRKYSILYQDVMTKYHEKDAYVKILSDKKLNDVMKNIEKQSTIDDNRDIEYLIKQLGITDLQAKFILNAGNKTRSKGYLEKYKAEAEEYKRLGDLYLSKILSDDELKKEIRQELIDIKKKYATPRKCRLISANNDIPAGIFRIVVTDNNFIRKIPVNDPVKCVKGGSNENPKIVFNVDNRDDIILFDEQGYVYKYPVHKLPLCDKTNHGVDVRIIMKKLTSNIIKVFSADMIGKVMKNPLKHYLVIITAGNKIKKIDMDDIINTPTSGILYTKLYPGDIVKDICLVPINFDVVIYTQRRALRIENSEIRQLKRNALGMIAMNTNEALEGISVVLPNTTDIVVVTRKGKINKIDVAAFKRGKRAQAGSAVIRLGKDDSIFAVLGINENDSISISTDKSKVIIPVKDIPKASSASGGTSVIKGSVLKCKIVTNK